MCITTSCKNISPVYLRVWKVKRGASESQPSSPLSAAYRQQLVGWLWIKCHIRLRPRHRTLTLFQGTANRPICGELKRLPRRLNGNPTRVASAESQMRASEPIAPHRQQFPAPNVPKVPINATSSLHTHAAIQESSFKWFTSIWEKSLLGKNHHCIFKAIFLIKYEKYYVKSGGYVPPGFLERGVRVPTIPPGGDATAYLQSQWAAKCHTMPLHKFWMSDPYKTATHT